MLCPAVRYHLPHPLLFSLNPAHTAVKKKISLSNSPCYPSCVRCDRSEIHPQQSRPTVLNLLHYSRHLRVQVMSHLFHLLPEPDLSLLRPGVAESPVFSWGLSIPLNCPSPSKGANRQRKRGSEETTLSPGPSFLLQFLQHVAIGLSLGKLTSRDLAILIGRCHEAIAP